MESATLWKIMMVCLVKTDRVVSLTIDIASRFSVQTLIKDKVVCPTEVTDRLVTGDILIVEK